MATECIMSVSQSNARNIALTQVLPYLFIIIISTECKSKVYNVVRVKNFLKSVVLRHVNNCEKNVGL